MSPESELEFRWKEDVIYWEGAHGFLFDGGWGVQPPVTYVPDETAWDTAVPDWMRGRRSEILGRLRTDRRHRVEESPDGWGSPAGRERFR